MFDFRVQARKPATLSALAVSLAAAIIAWIMNLPMISGAVTLAFVGPLIWRIAFNTRFGFTIGPRTLEVFAPGLHRIIPLLRVERVEILGLRRGITCDMVLTSGETLRLPHCTRASPDAIGKAFRARGITVVS